MRSFTSAFTTLLFVLAIMGSTIQILAWNENDSSPAAATAASAASAPIRTEGLSDADLRQLAEQSKTNPDALGRLVKACDVGDGKACQYTALLYASTKSGFQNLEKAVGYFHKGCDAGVAKSCRDAGLLYASAKTGMQNLTKAVGYFQKSCEAGHARSCIEAGLLYLDDKSVIRRDNRRALELMTRSCGLGEMEACFIQGSLLLSTPDLQANLVTALELYWKACEGNYGKACFTLAEFAAIAHDPQSTKRLYMQACIYGAPEACKKFTRPVLPNDAPQGSWQAYSSPRAAVYVIPDSDVFVVVAEDDKAGTLAKNEFLHSLVCAPKGHWESEKQSLTTGSAGKQIEVVTARCSASKQTRDFKFDISSYSGKP